MVLVFVFGGVSACDRHVFFPPAVSSTSLSLRTFPELFCLVVYIQPLLQPVADEEEDEEEEEDDDRGDEMSGLQDALASQRCVFVVPHVVELKFQAFGKGQRVQRCDDVIFYFL